MPGSRTWPSIGRWGNPTCSITPDRQVCSRYGLNVGDVGAAVQAAIGGQAVTQVLEGDRRFDLVVRWQPNYRQSSEAIRQIQVALPGAEAMSRSAKSPT